jgi:hypothetical protein
MSSNSCLVMHPSSSEGMHDDIHDTNSESSCDRSEASSQRQELQHGSQVPSPSTPVAASQPHARLRNVTNSEGSDIGSPRAASAQTPSAESRKRDCSGISDETDQAEEQEDVLSSLPQHGELEWHDADFETTLISQRNRRVLMTRLYETAPRGRLSLVSVYLDYGSCTDVTRLDLVLTLWLFFMLYRLISHEEESAWKMPSC